MKKRFNSLSALSNVLATLAVVLAGLPFSGVAQVAPARPTLPNFDQRTAEVPKKIARQQLSAAKKNAETLLKSRVPGLRVEVDPLLQTPKFIRSSQGFLSGPDGQGGAISPGVAQLFATDDSYRSVKAFLDEHSALFGHGAEVLTGATVKRDSVGAHNGLRTVVWQQQLDGIPVFEGVLIGNIAKHGQLVSLASQFMADPGSKANAGMPNRSAIQAQPPVSAVQAIVKASQNLGEGMAAASVVTTGQSVGDGSYQVFKMGTEKVYARQVWIPMDSSSLRLGWEVWITSRLTRERFQELVDAETGSVIKRQLMTAYISDASYRVYTSDSPAPFSPGSSTPSSFQAPMVARDLVTTNAFSVNASPNGWINDGVNETLGNNVDGRLDRDFDGQPDGPRPAGSPTRVFDFPIDFNQDPSSYPNAAITELFYWCNVYHDRLYELGFTEAAGNFQTDNFGRGGFGGDAIEANAQSGANVGASDNAFFSGGPDGIPGSVNMFVFSGPNPQRDGDLDADVIMHEATHGVSTRLVGGGVGISALQTGGMGEGWSDFVELSLLSQPADDVNGNYATGGYVTYQFVGLPFTENYYFGIRHYPYSTDMSKNPFTFKDIDPAQISSHPGIPLSAVYSPFSAGEANEVHHAGEVWCVTLWDARANIITKHGFAAGNQLMLQLVIDGMKLAPANPNFLQARDAIILADLVDTGGANFTDLWKAFAKRGMGVSATSPNSSSTAGLFEAFDLPGLIIDSTVISGGNGNGVIDFNECNDLQIVLKNAGASSATGITTKLSTTTPGVIIAQPISTYPSIPSGSNAVNVTSFKVSTSPTFVCGTPVDLILVIKSDLETRTNHLSLASGSPGPAVRFDNNIIVPIPDNNPVGASSLITVTNMTSAINKVTVALHIGHTFDSDLVIQLVSPDGTTNTLSANNGFFGQDFGFGCFPDSNRTIFDDAATNLLASANAPFVGTFRPDQPLAIFNGKVSGALNGVWQLHVVDQAAFDTGSILCWSLFISPTVCVDGGGQCPGNDLAIGMSALPTPVTVGSNLTYTISVTNYGPDTAKAVTLNHSLPPSAIFVSATASQGAPIHSGNSVICLLGNLNVGQTAQMTVVVTPTSVGTVSSTATVGGSQQEIDPSNNTVTLNTLVNPPTADLAVALLGNPDPVANGSLLTYTVSVTNKGPSAASNVMLTNALPASVIFSSASLSQGTFSISGNSIICNLGTIFSGGNATVAIFVIPTALGQITATSTVGASQSDPAPGNNTAGIITSVTASADLGVGLVAPSSSLLNSNFFYGISVTNRGPNIATGVVLNDTLPNGLSIVSATSSQGTVSPSGNFVTFNIGTLGNGAVATASILVTATNVGTFNNSVSVTASQADPSPADNSATARTRVASPFTNIVAAGSKIISESQVPANGAVNIGETVTVSLLLQNNGNVSNANLTATLLATGGVTAPSGPQPYGALAPGGFPSVAKPFTFTASGTNGGTVTATLQLQDGATTLPPAKFTFVLPNVSVFADTNTIVINDNGPASPYPATNLVSGMSGIVGKVAVTLTNLNHTYSEDVDILLVSPAGQKIILMSDAGGGSLLSGTSLTFDDTADIYLPQAGQIFSGTYKPSPYGTVDFATNAPAAPYATTLSVLNGSNPNGTWSLYVMDGSAGDAGSIVGGWSLAITTITPVNQVADLSLTGTSGPNPVLVTGTLTNTFSIANSGPDTATSVALTNALPTNASLVSVTLSQGSYFTNNGMLVCGLGNLPSGSNATVTVVMIPTAAGSVTSSANISAFEGDLNLLNNAVTLSATANPTIADVAVAVQATPNPAVVGNNLSFTVTVTNNGPGTALNVTVTDPLPAGLAFVSATSSVGTCSNSSGTVTCNFGNLPTGVAATMTVIVNASQPSTTTNVVTAATLSVDSVSTNNSASVAVVAAFPAPIILASGATLTAESLAPANGAIDPGEAVSISFRLVNNGSADTTNLVATLLSTGGVTSPSGAQNFGALIHGGASAARSFSFTAAGATGGVVTATLQLQDGSKNLGTVSFAFNFVSVTSAANTAAIAIPESGPASPYPSTINISGLAGLVTRLNLTLNGLTHGFPDDLRMLLVGPTGQKLVFLAGVGGGHGITNVTLTFDDAASASLPASTLISSGTFKPTNLGSANSMPFPAPAAPYNDSLLSSFNGTNPNGNWSLYVLDSAAGDGGVISGGWSLDITIVSPINSIADMTTTMTKSASTRYTGDLFTYTVKAANNGPTTSTGVILTDTLPAGLNAVSLVPSQGGAVNVNGTITWNVGSLSSGANATLAITTSAAAAGVFTNMASLTANEIDLNTANNSSQASVTVLTVVPPLLASSAMQASGNFQLTLVGQTGETYVIEASTNLVNWTSVATNTISGSAYKFTDANSHSFTQRYYRAVRVP